MKKLLIFTLFILFGISTPAPAQTPTFVKLNVSPTTTLKFSDPTAIHNATYQYYITAVNAAGVESAPSATITVFASVTAGGLNPTPAQTAASTRTIDLTWTEVSTGVTFNVYRTLVSGPPVVALPPDSPANLAATIRFN